MIVSRAPVRFSLGGGGSDDVHGATFLEIATASGGR
jgi:galactokinase/mevalonate kinase-like predicted kinase